MFHDRKSHICEKLCVELFIKRFEVEVSLVVLIREAHFVSDSDVKLKM